jgi:hypothetical protein
MEENVGLKAKNFKANIDILGRQHACNDLPQTSLLSVHNSSRSHNNTYTAIIQARVTTIHTQR